MVIKYIYGFIITRLIFRKVDIKEFNKESHFAPMGSKLLTLEFEQPIFVVGVTIGNEITPKP